jgi:excisionase family DNA binding protein
MTVDHSPGPSCAAHADRLAVNPQETADITGLSRSTVYNLINSGQLRSVCVGSRRLIPMSAIPNSWGRGSNDPRDATNAGKGGRRWSCTFLVVMSPRAMYQPVAWCPSLRR